MSKRCFLLAPAYRPVAGITFDRYDVIGGVVHGIYGTEDEKEIAALLEAAKEPKNGLKEVTEAQFVAMDQKKMIGGANYRASNAPTVPVIQQTPMQAAAAALKGAGAVVDNEPNPPVVDEDAAAPDAGLEPVPAVTDALKVSEVTPPITATPRRGRPPKAKDSDVDAS